MNDRPADSDRLYRGEIGYGMLYVPFNALLGYIRATTSKEMKFETYDSGNYNSYSTL